MGLEDLSIWKILIVLVVLVLLFGSKRLPDAARGIGRSLRIFKAEVRGLDDPPAAPQDRADPPQVTPTPQITAASTAQTPASADAGRADTGTAGAGQRADTAADQATQS